MQKTNIGGSAILVLAMACGCGAFTPSLLPSSTVLYRNFASLSPSAWSCAQAPTRASLRQVSGVYMAAAAGKAKDGDAKPKKVVAKQVLDLTAPFGRGGGLLHFAGVCR